MFEFDNILLGPLRALLLFGGGLLLHQIIVRQSLKAYHLDYIVKRVVILGSLLTSAIFILAQMNMYNIFSILILVVIILALRYLDPGRLDHVGFNIGEKKRRFLLSFFKFMERKIGAKKLIPRISKFFFPKRISLALITSFIVAITTLISRYLFLKSDLYTLSSLWIKNLELVKDFNANIWLGNSESAIGEMAIINFYAKITGISEEMALHSFGLLESFGLSVILYWIILNLTKNRLIAPMIAVLFFALFYKYLPLNTNLLLKHNSLYFALCFALPAIVFTSTPKLLSLFKRRYFLLLALIYLGVGLTNFFVSLILLPVFLVVCLVLQVRHNIQFVSYSLLAYLAGTGTALGIYGIGCYTMNKSFPEFIRSSLILVNSYTHFPQLITTPENLVQLFFYFGCIVILILLPLLFINYRRWSPAAVFVISATLLFSLAPYHFPWLDIDLFYASVSPLIVIVGGVFIGILSCYYKMAFPKSFIPRAFAAGVTFCIILFLAYGSNKFLHHDPKEIDQLKTGVLEAYNNLSSNHMPFSYAVVNQGYGYNLSKNEHHFIDYNNFITLYPIRDSIYQLRREDRKFLDQNPDFILPQSVFVFITKTDLNDHIYKLSTPPDMAQKLYHQLDSLENKGRTVELYYEDDYLQVYEIVNQQNASKLNDLILNL